MTKTRKIPAHVIEAYAAKLEIHPWHAERELLRRNWLMQQISRIETSLEMLTTFNPNRREARMLKPEEL